MTMRSTTQGVTLAALMAALGRPTWWVLALCGFLIRGGIVLFLLAIVILPSPLALSNVLAPIITPVYFGRIDATSAIVIIGAVVLAVAWLLAASWFAAATEVVLVRDAHAVASDEGLPISAVPGTQRRVIVRAAAAHLLALVPFAVVLVGGSVAILEVVYRELVNPSGSASLVMRVAGGAALPAAAIVGVWVVGELVGGIAARRIVLRGEGVLSAVGHATGDLVLHPVGHLVAPLLTIGVLALDLVAVLLTVAIIWSDLRDRLARALDDPLATGLTLVTFVGAWFLALVVTGLIASWRSTAMTFEAERAAASAEPLGGTFGASAHQPLGG
jgi:hypothetical protein